MRIVLLVLSLLPIVAFCESIKREHIDMQATGSVTKAAFDCIKPANPSGVLVLLPGYNEDGSKYLEERAWTRFATERNWAIIGVTFVSPVEELKRNGGYYDATAGSGLALLRAVKKMGLLDKPLYLYGFSGGGRFAARFADSYSKYVAAFAAHALGEIPECEYRDGPRGIVSCGSEDPRLGSAFSWFKDARAAGWRLSWVEVPNLGHTRSMSVEDFVRRWFGDESRRRATDAEGVECEIGNGVVCKDLAGSPATRSWFPSRRACDVWRSSFGPHSAISRHTRPKGRKDKEGSNVFAIKAKGENVFKREIFTKVEECPKLTLYGRYPRSNTARGVICLSLIANDVGDIEALLKGENREGVVGEWLWYAENNDLVVLAWAAPRGLWRPHENWDDGMRKDNRDIDRSFISVAAAWKSSVEKLARERDFPNSGFLMIGFSRAAQFAQRLALHSPAKFVAVAVHVPSSFDYPVPEGKNIVWCLTTGENESGYERSLRFVAAAKKNRYPIVYKAYPGLGHSDSLLACKLGQKVFDFVLDGGSGMLTDSSRWPYVADYVNQRTAPYSDAVGMPSEFLVGLPNAEVESAWRKE